MKAAVHKVGGIHAVRSAIKHGPEKVITLWLVNSRKDRRINELEEQAKLQGISVNRVNKPKLDELVPEVNHQGAVVEIKAPAPASEKSLYALLDQLQGNCLLLVLDGVTDPHNLGACLRSADASGVNAVIAPKDNSAGLTPVACKVASGAAETVPYVQVTNLARTMEKLKQDYNIWLYGTAGEAEKSIYQADYAGNVALVLGAEGKGLRRLTRETCDELYHLPMSGSVESLNVSVAAGVCLFEVVRQKLS